MASRLDRLAFYDGATSLSDVPPTGQVTMTQKATFVRQHRPAGVHDRIAGDLRRIRPVERSAEAWLRVAQS